MVPHDPFSATVATAGITVTHLAVTVTGARLTYTPVRGRPEGGGISGLIEVVLAWILSSILYELTIASVTAKVNYICYYYKYIIL